MNSAFNGHIVLVGPSGVGKTSVAEMISERLKIDHVPLDLAEHSLQQLGWQDKESFRLRMKVGYEAQLKYRSQFTVPLIQLVMDKYPSAVIDCGADELVGWTDKDRREIKNSIGSLGLKYTALILPFPDIEETRSHFAAQTNTFELNELLLANPSYWQIANKIFYTQARDLNPVVEAIIAWATDTSS